MERWECPECGAVAFALKGTIMVTHPHNDMGTNRVVEFVRTSNGV